MAERSPFLTEIGSVVDEYNYGGMSADEIGAMGESGISLDSILSKPDVAKSAGGSGDMFSAGNIGSTLQGGAAIASIAAGVYDTHNRKKYQDKVFKMEEERVNRANARQDKQQAAYEKVFG